MGLISTKKGSKLRYGGQEMRVHSARDLDTLILVSVDGEYYNASIKDLEKEAKGTVKEHVSSDAIRASKVSSYHEALKDILDKPRRTAAEIESAATRLKISKASVYNALKRFEETGSIDSLPPPTRPGGKGKSRLLPGVEKIIEAGIEKYLLKGRSTPRAFYRKVKQDLTKAGLQVSQGTLASRVSRIPAYRWSKARTGYNETRRTLDPIKDHYPEPQRPLEVVQIDHWKADIEILSEDRLTTIGRIWITLAIDVYSRMVFGVHVGIDAPSTATFGMCMINGMLRKDALAEQYGIEWDNPIGGRPERLEADNAGEFTGSSAQSSCNHFNIRLKWRPVDEPQYGGHIERLNGNLALRFKDLPGATGSTPQERKRLKPEKTAAFTLEDATKHVLLLIDEYHNEVHTGIGVGTTPLRKFKSYFFGPEGQKNRLPQVFVDNEQFRLHWYPRETRTIQRYGIKIDHLEYYSQSLKWLVRNRKDYGPVEVRRHPFDVRVIYVKHPNRLEEDPDAPKDEHWIPVYVRRLNFPVASIAQLKEAQREALRQKRKPTPDVLAKIIEQQARHIEEAVKKTKTASRIAARNAQHERLRKQEAKANKAKGGKDEAGAKSSSNPDTDAQTTSTAPFPSSDLSSILSQISDDDVDELFR